MTSTDSSPFPGSPSYPTLLWRAWRLRCPRCGGPRLFKSYFSMQPRCAVCHLIYEREPGFFLGSAYINYGITALVATILYLALFVSGQRELAFWIVLAFTIIFPIWFFRYARSLWLAFDNYWDPQPEEEEEVGDR
jgi:uncharacterized protein (DUF983 family)